MRVEQGGTMGDTMTYTYLGDGTKAAARVGAADAGKRYRGSYVYDVTAAGVQSLESVAVSTGRLVALTGTNGSLSFEHDGFITDHLGNVAAVVNLSASSSTSTRNVILEQNDYTPFGMRLEPAVKTLAANRWRYAGKEEQRIAGMDLHLIDFGARYYDPFTCRWNATDPLAHKYFSMSPYNYCGNDPVNFFDPDGKDIVVEGSDEFKQKYKDMRNWLRDCKCDASLIMLEKNTDVIISVSESSKNKSTVYFDKKSLNLKKGEIAWNPDYYFLSNDNYGKNEMMLSPSVCFMHEVDHQVKALSNGPKYLSDEKQTDSNYGNMSEESAITGTELVVARALGEIGPGQVTRHSHKGKFGPSVRGFSPKNQSNFVFLYNSFPSIPKPKH